MRMSVGRRGGGVVMPGKRVKAQGPVGERNVTRRKVRFNIIEGADDHMLRE